MTDYQEKCSLQAGCSESQPAGPRLRSPTNIPATGDLELKSGNPHLRHLFRQIQTSIDLQYKMIAVLGRNRTDNN